MLGYVKLEDVSDICVSTSSSSFDPNAGFTATVPLPNNSSALNVIIKNDQSYDIPMLHSINRRHPWRNCLPAEHCSNYWIIAINEEECITAAGVLETLKCLRDNYVTEVVIRLHKRSTYNGTLLSDCRSLFDQFERPPPAIIVSNSSKSPASASSIQPASHYVVDSASPITKPKHFTDTLSGHHSYFWKLATFEHYDQNASMLLCSIPFPISQVPDRYKIYKPVLAPKVKNDYKLHNVCNLKMRLCQNGNVDSGNKNIQKCSPTALADSLRFTIGISAFFGFTISIADVVNCF